MYVAEIKLSSKPGSPFSPSRYHEEPKLTKELPDAYEQRTWRNKCHFDPNTKQAYIPGTMVKKAVEIAASMKAERIPGRGVSTYTKHFVSGIIVEGQIDLGVTIDKCEGVRLYQNADGKRGGSKRVMRHFPIFPKWSGQLTLYVVDSMLTRDVVERHLVEAGILVGLGRWRPAVGGMNGRFDAKILKWEER